MLTSVLVLMKPASTQMGQPSASVRLALTETSLEETARVCSFFFSSYFIFQSDNLEKVKLFLIVLSHLMEKFNYTKLD